MTMPWDEKPEELDDFEDDKPELTLADYIAFLDSHVRMRVSIGSVVKGYFAVLDEGGELECVTALPDGRPVIFEVMPGPARTNEPIATPAALVAWVIEGAKNETH